jgi:hypothetical protein
MEKGKGTEISRRDFIKDLGSGTIGAAIISTQLAGPSRVGAASSPLVESPLVEIKARPPLKDLWDKWNGIRQTTQTILDAFAKNAGNVGAKQVNWRLNESGTTDKVPVFIDWLAMPDVMQNFAKVSGINPLDWGRYRLGDGIISEVYKGAVGNPPQLIYRDQKLKKEKTAASLELVMKAGLNYQKFIGIIATQNGKKRCVGALTVSFAGTPNDLGKVDQKMKEWAGWTDGPSPLVNYITQNFVLGGPDITPQKKK